MISAAHEGDTSPLGPILLTAVFALFDAISVFVGLLNLRHRCSSPLDADQQAVVKSAGHATAHEEAGESPARSRHCDRGADLQA